MISALPSALEPAFKFRAEGEEENAVYAHPRGLSSAEKIPAAD